MCQVAPKQRHILPNARSHLRSEDGVVNSSRGVLVAAVWHVEAQSLEPKALKEMPNQNNLKQSCYVNQT